MSSYRTSGFRGRYRELDSTAMARADEAYARWRKDPWHHGLRFKCVDAAEDIWSARIGRDHRALCTRSVEHGEVVYTWFWIGPHDEYERLISA